MIHQLFIVYKEDKKGLYMSKTMKLSFFEKGIKHEKLGMISMYQKMILDAYQMDEKIFYRKVVDYQTGKEYTFSRWSSMDESDSIYDYMDRMGYDMDDLEASYNRRKNLFQTYAPRLEIGDI